MHYSRKASHEPLYESSIVCSLSFMRNRCSMVNEIDSCRYDSCYIICGVTKQALGHENI